MKSPASAARLPPFALEDAPSLIEALCPAQKVSFEAQEKAKGQHWGDPDGARFLLEGPQAADPGAGDCAPLAPTLQRGSKS